MGGVLSATKTTPSNSPLVKGENQIASSLLLDYLAAPWVERATWFYFKYSPTTSSSVGLPYLRLSEAWHCSCCYGFLLILWIIADEHHRDFYGGLQFLDQVDA